MNGRLRALWAMPVFVLSAFFPTDAWAWRCSRVPDNSGYESGPALAWKTRNLTYAISTAGTSQLSEADSTRIVQQAFATWQNATLRFGQDATCDAVAVAGVPKATDLTFSQLPATTQNYAGRNYLNPNENLNLVVFRDASWPHLLVGDSSDLMALTTTSYNATTGEIIDADIEINTHDYVFSTSDTDVTYDLLSTLTHEVGHFLGFGHSDNADAVMYGSPTRGDISKRTLSCDDATILWYRYPAGAATNACGKNAAVNAACGFCQATGVLYEVPEVRVQNRYDGFGGCHCQGGAASTLAMALPALALMVRRAKKRAR